MPNQETPRSTFAEARARNMAANAFLLNPLEQLAAAVAPSTPAASSSRKTTAPKSGSPTRKSARVAALPEKDLSEKALMPELPVFRKFAPAAPSKGKGKEKDTERKDEVGEGHGNGSGPQKAYQNKHEYGLMSVTMTEFDLAAIRDNYPVIRLLTFRVNGVHSPTAYSAVKKSVRLTNEEFRRWNIRRTNLGLPVAVRKTEQNPVWVAASIVASARYEGVLEKKARKALAAARAGEELGEQEAEEEGEDEGENDGEDDEDME